MLHQKGPSTTFSKEKSRRSHKIMGVDKEETVYCLRTGKKILDARQTISNINSKRVLSYKKIAFNIRKMDALFKDRLKTEDLEEMQSSPLIKIDQYDTLRMSTEHLKKGAVNHGPKRSQLFLPAKPNRNLVFRDDLLSQQQSLVNIKNRIKTQYDLLGEDKLKKKLIDSIDSPIKYQQESKATRKNERQIIKLIATQQIQELSKQEIIGVTFKKKDFTSPLTTKKKDSILLSSNIKSQTQNSTSPFKQARSTTIFNDRSSTNISKNKESYLHWNQLLSRDQDRKIQEMYHLRNESYIYTQPKQWQYYNILNLKELSLHRTNLKLSGENWVLIDYSEIKYLRGWHPKEIRECSIALRLFLSNIVTHLTCNLKIDLQKVTIRINNDLLTSKVEGAKGDYQFQLKNNTIISLWDLFVGVVLNKQIDLQWHLIYGIACLYKNYNCYGESFEKQNIAQYSNYIWIIKKQLTIQYQNIFMNLCKQVCLKLNLKYFSFHNKVHKYILMKGNKLLIDSNEQYNNSLFKEQNEMEYLSIEGNCVQTAVLFVQCMSYPPFHHLITTTATSHIAPIRYQVGYKFWEDRRHKFRNQLAIEKNKSNTFMLQLNQATKFWSMLSYNCVQKVLVVCNEVRTNMWLKDNDSIINWMRSTLRRHSPQRSKYKL